MKKSLLLILAVAGLLAANGLEAKKGWKGGHHGGGWRRHHRRHGWGWGGGPRFGFGISLGAPVADVAYLDDPYDWYFSKYPGASWDAYGAWLEANSHRLRRPYRYYHGPRFHRRWKTRPRVGFGIGFGF